MQMLINVNQPPAFSGHEPLLPNALCRRYVLAKQLRLTDFEQLKDSLVFVLEVLNQ